MKKNKGARWEIIVDGKPRSYRDCKETALEGARLLKGRQLARQVLVRDLEGGEADLIVVSSIPQAGVERAPRR